MFAIEQGFRNFQTNIPPHRSLPVYHLITKIKLMHENLFNKKHLSIIKFVFRLATLY